MSRTIRSTVVCALLALLVAGAASALPWGARPAQEPGRLAVAWDWLASLLSPAWNKEGSSMDPNGSPKAGSDMDPNGLTADGSCSTTEAGSQMDPDGLTGPDPCPTAEAGADMDPNG